MKLKQKFDEISFDYIYGSIFFITFCLIGTFNVNDLSKMVEIQITWVVIPFLIMYVLIKKMVTLK